MSAVAPIEPAGAESEARSTDLAAVGTLVPPPSPSPSPMGRPKLVLQLSSVDEPPPAPVAGMLGALKAHHKEQISPEESLKEVQGDGPADLATDTCRFKRLGKGAGGAVYLACYLPSLQLIAIKEVVMHHVEDQHMVAHELHALHDNLVPLVQAATHKSIKFLGKLSHRKLHIGIAHPCPQIVSFYGAFATPKKTSVSIAMEYMDCGTLQTFIDKKIVLPEAILQHIAYCTTQALAHMHRHRMLHRDIKPANILVDHNGEFKIADFGLASTLSKSASYSSEFQGTMMYMSPERIQGNEYSYPSDIWSIGVTLLTLSLGAYPFDNQDGFFGLEDAIVNEPIPGAPTTFSAACQAYITALLVKDPSTRLTAEEALAHEFLKDYSRAPAYEAVWATVSPQTHMRPEDIRALVHAIRRHEASLSKTRDDAFDFQSHDLESPSVAPSSWSLKHVANLAATCATSVETLLALFQEPLPDEANPIDI